MPDAVVRAALRRAIDQIRYLRPVPAKAANPLTTEVYRQLEADFGMLAPPIALHAPVPELLAASWLMLRESLIADAALPRSTLEAVAAAVSAGNACPYCTTVHRATGQALPAGESMPAIEDWVRLAADRDTAGRPPVAATPPGPAAAARLIGVLATFHYLNRMVNIFLGESPLPAGLPGVLQAPALQLLGRFTAANAGRRHPAGTSVDLLPAAPGSPAWTAADPILGQAFARAAAAIDRMATRHVPASVRQLLTELLSRWNGRDPGLDMRWLAEPVAALPVVDRPAGRLALLTAFASYRIQESHVAEFRLAKPTDSSLLSVTSWASMATARQIADWIAVDAIGSVVGRGNV